jgi:hypothetical protein
MAQATAAACKGQIKPARTESPAARCCMRALTASRAVCRADVKRERFSEDLSTFANKLVFKNQVTADSAWHT